MKHPINVNALLRKAGMKVTLGHIEILSMIAKSKKPVSSQDIIDALGKKFNPATIYRCVAKLKNSGLIRQIDLRQNHAQYEFFDAHHHHHIVCTQCGKIEDIENQALEEIIAEVAGKTKHFEDIKQHSLEFFGVCKTCATKKSA